MVHCTSTLAAPTQVNFFVTIAHRIFAALLAAASLLPGTTALAQAAPVFVLNSLDATVSVIDPVTWTETRRFATGKEPHHLYLSPDEKSLIIANALGDSLLFVDPRTGAVQRTVRDILDPYHLRFSPDMKWFVIAGNRLNHLDIYKWDGKDLSLAKRISTGKTPSHLWINSTSTTVFASMQESDEIVTVDLPTQTLKSRVKSGNLPADVFGTPDDKFLLVGLTGGSGVEVYDTTGDMPRLVKTIPTGAGAHAFRAAGDKRHVYVSNRVANTISKIDYQTMTVVASYAAPGGPDCMDVSADGRYIYVASRWAQFLTVIDTATGKIAKRVKVGRSPHGVWTLDHAARQ
jgi:YVTN family beta-propeller protein